MTRKSLALLVFAVAGPGGFLRADVRVVADDGSTPYSTIQAAVDAADDRDVILVRPGTYTGFEINNESLTVTAEIGTRVTVNGSVRVRNLAAERSVLLSNLDVRGNFNAPLALGHGLRAQNCAGSLRAQSCSFTAFQSPVPVGTGDNNGREGASLFLCADVIFTDCEFLGGEGRDIYDCCDHGTRGGDGIENNASVLALYDCRAEGHEGSYSGWGGHGGRGVAQLGPALYAAGCTLIGGQGGFGDDFIFGPGGDGGDALFAASGSNSVLVDATLLPGAPGDSFLGSPGAVAGSPIAGPGNVNSSFAASRHFRSSHIAWAGGELGIAIEGEPGDRVRIAASATSDYVYRANVNGVWTPAQPADIAPQSVGGGASSLVTLPASGKLTVPVDVFALGAGIAGSPWFLQGYVVSTSGTQHLTSPLMVTRLTCNFSPDCNGNGNPDGCDVQGGSSNDCDFNGIPDECDLGTTALDCNGNGIPDSCDLNSGLSSDCNADFVPDECQIDCNANGVPDDCDVLAGTSLDCDGNLVPDECSIDCNANGVPDLCDIAGGTSLDSNGNNVPDECQSPTDTYYVDDSSVSWGDGTLALPFDSIGQAVDYAIGGNTVVVLDGTYSGSANHDVSFGGRDLVVRSQNGFANCVIDLGGVGRAFHLTGGETQAARIEGFTIQNGHLDTGGAAILCENASPLIVDCWLRDLSTGFTGGAIRFTGSLGSGTTGARVLSCTFTDITSFRGGGIASTHSSGKLRIEDCQFTANHGSQGSAMYLNAVGGETLVRGADIRGNVSSYGGAIYQSGGDLAVTESIVAENDGNFGGGIHVENGDSFRMSHTILAANRAINSQGGGLALLDFNDSMVVRIHDCLIFANTSNTIGGGMVLRDADNMRITNCSFFLNESGQGGGLHISGNGTHLVRNSLFWENHATTTGPQILVTEATTDVDYCNLQGGSNGIATAFGGTLIYSTHNSSVYPGFVDPDGADNDITTWEDNDVRLGPTSAARDAGDNSAVEADVLDLDGDGNTSEPVPFDLNGNPRFVDSNQPDSGNGTAPIVDLGCYEDQ